MNIKVDINDNRCNFEQCRYYENHICLDEKARRECLGIAFDVLCVDTEKIDEWKCGKDEVEP